MAISQNFPSIAPSLSLNFASSRTLDPRITFTRASVGTYVGRDGLIKTAGNDEARFDHDPETLESLGLLIEESRTNFALDSNDYSINTSTINASITTNVITAPDGTLTADMITASAGSAQHGPAKNTTGLPINSVCSLSVFVKAGTHNFCRLDSASITNWSTNAGVTVNLTNGTIISGSGTVEPYPNGWYRITIYPTSNSTAGASRGMWVWVTGSDGNSTYNAVGTETIHVWGAQIEAGSFRTSYIPTSGAAATRGEDRADIRGDAFQSIFNSNFNEFSGVIEFDNDDLPQPPSASYYSIFELWGESTNFENRLQITRDNDSPYGIETRGFGSNTALFSNGNISGSNTAAVKKLAFSWNIPDYSTTTGRRWAFSFSGEAVDLVNTNNGTGLPQFTRMGIGYSPTRNEGQSKTHFKRITIYPKVLTDTQLQALTK